MHWCGSKALFGVITCSGSLESMQWWWLRMLTEMYPGTSLWEAEI